MRGLLILALLPSVTQAQAGTDIFLAALSRSGDAVTVAAPANVTARSGYDNQPSFTPDGRAILFTSIRDDRPADTYRYDLESRTTTRLTHTAESEYSPTVVPGGTHFSVIQVEADSTQRLWKFRLDGSAPELVLTDIRPVGYHAWADDHTLGLFVLGDPSTLRIADTRTGRADVVAESIGRSIHKVPGAAAISFLHRVGAEPPYIKIIDLASRTIRSVAPALEGNEYYAWLPDGTLIMGSGSKLFTRAPNGERWVEVADLSAHGVSGMSRLAVSPDGGMLAIVANDRAPGGTTLRMRDWPPRTLNFVAGNGAIQAGNGEVEASRRRSEGRNSRFEAGIKGCQAGNGAFEAPSTGCEALNRSSDAANNGFEAGNGASNPEETVSTAGSGGFEAGRSG